MPIAPPFKYNSLFNATIQFVTNFPVCNLHFVSSMTSMHISHNIYISDNIEQKKLFGMISEKKKMLVRKVNNFSERICFA